MNNSDSKSKSKKIKLILNILKGYNKPILTYISKINQEYLKEKLMNILQI